MTEYFAISKMLHPSMPRSSEMTLRQTAMKLEATFLGEMLKSTGFGKQESSFSGGIGENYFAQLQRQAVAEEMVRKGGVGIAEHIFKTLKEQSDAK